VCHGRGLQTLGQEELVRSVEGAGGKPKANHIPRIEYCPAEAQQACRLIEHRPQQSSASVLAIVLGDAIHLCSPCGPTVIESISIPRLHLAKHCARAMPLLQWVTPSCYRAS